MWWKCDLCHFMCHHQNHLVALGIICSRLHHVQFSNSLIVCGNHVKSDVKRYFYLYDERQQIVINPTLIIYITQTFAKIKIPKVGLITACAWQPTYQSNLFILQTIHTGFNGFFLSFVNDEALWHLWPKWHNQMIPSFIAKSIESENIEKCLLDTTAKSYTGFNRETRWEEQKRRMLIWHFVAKQYIVKKSHHIYSSHLDVSVIHIWHDIFVLVSC